MNVLLLFLLSVFVMHTCQAAYSRDTLQRRLERHLQNIINDKRLSPYHHAASKIHSTYKHAKLAFSQQVLTDLERVQEAVSRLRGPQKRHFFVNERHWTTWSVAHSQAVIFDRAHRIWSLIGSGRAHRVNLQNFEKSALLLGIALASTVSDGNVRRRNYILDNVAPPLVSAIRNADVDGKFSGLAVVIGHHGHESGHVLMDILSYAVVLMVSYVFVKRIVSV